MNSTTVTADANGNLLSETRYSAFGEIRYSNGATVTDKLYTGQQQETEIGLDYYIARFYDPVIAHFIQPDSLIPQASASASYDRYAYVNGNPINFNDPSGHSPECILGSASGCLQWAGLTGVNAAAGLEKYSDDVHANLSIYGVDASNVRLDLAQKALMAVAAAANAVSTVNGLPPQLALQKAAGSFSIHQVYDPEFLGFAPPFTRAVFIGPTSSITNIVHEIGHRIDFYGSGGNPLRYKSQTFIEMNSPGCKPGYVGCLNNSADNLYAFVNFLTSGSPRGTYSVLSETWTTAYGQRASIEDYAESFTVWVRNTADFGLDPNIRVDPARLALIVDSLN